MSDHHDLARLGALALDAERARQVAAGLLRARNACLCDRGEAGWHRTADCIEDPAEAPDPCWRTREPNRDGEPMPLPEEAWCPTCRARQFLHESYLAACKHLGHARRRLTLAARRLAGKEQT